MLLKLEHLVLGKDYHIFVTGKHIQTKKKMKIDCKRDWSI